MHIGIQQFDPGDKRCTKTHPGQKKKKGQSTLSKAFPWCSNKMAAGTLNSFANVTASLKKATFSPMKRPGTPQV